jgi:hypothetical protein
MANLWTLDGFERWDQSHPNAKWQIISDPGGLEVSANYGRNGGGLKITTGGTKVATRVPTEEGAVPTRCAVLESIFGVSTIWTIGFAFKFVDVGLLGDQPLCAIISSSPPYEDFLGTYYASYISLYFCRDQRIRMVHGDWRTPSYRVDFTPALRRGVYYFIEWEVDLAGNNLRGWLDGEELVDEPQDLTRSISGVPLGAADAVRFFSNKSGVGGGRNVRSYYLDDIYVTDTVRFSDMAVEAVYPNGVGAHSDWTPNTGFPNWTHVDDAVPDDDTTNLTGAAGVVDTYAFSGPNETGGVIHGIVNNVNHYNKLFDVGQLSSVIRQSGADDISTAQQMGTFGYRYGQFGYLTNPHTASAFTQAEIAGDEFGFKRIT